jgi:hypothetical protein
MRVRTRLPRAASRPDAPTPSRQPAHRGSSDVSPFRDRTQSPRPGQANGPDATIPRSMRDPCVIDGPGTGHHRSALADIWKLRMRR